MRRVLAAGLLVLLFAPAVATAAPETCGGEKVTISFRDKGVGQRITGTPGRDVILGGPQNEVIDAGGGDDIVCGGGGDDQLDGGDGRDELYGQDGSDTFQGAGLAGDLVVGGSRDKDVAGYQASATGVRVDMTRGVVLADGATVRGGIQGIEVVRGTSMDDHLVGNAGPNTLIGLGGNDVLDGRGGPDRLYGNSGIDRVTYAWADKPVHVGLSAGVALVGNAPISENDDLEEIEVVVGTRRGDLIIGSDRDEQLIGGPGDDRIKGGLGDDTLEGGGGDDTLFPGLGDDTVDGGPNDPVRSAGAHGDLVSYEADTPKGLTGSFDFEAYLVPDPHFGDPPMAIGVGEDALIGIESIRGPKVGMSYLQGDDGPNVLIGGAKIDSIEGGAGNDLLYGLGSNDNLSGDAGDDYLDGGEPNGPGETDKLDGGDGDDTCLHARATFLTSCESTDES